jgi:replicative DNA helicase
LALVPALDLRDDHPNAPDAPDNRPPANVEAEQALLGALMYDNGALDLLRVDIQPQHFFEPFHQRLWESMTSAIRAGLLAEPIAFGEEFRRDPGFLELGGLRYLGDLVDRAPPAVSAPEYADLVFEMASLRTLIRIGEQMAAAARGKLRDADERRLTSAAIIEGSELDLLGLSVRGGSGRTNDLVDLGEAAGSVMAYVDDRSKPVGVRWGLNPIDVHVGTMMPLCCWAAGPRWGSRRSPWPRPSTSPPRPWPTT